MGKKLWFPVKIFPTKPILFVKRERENIERRTCDSWTQQICSFFRERAKGMKELLLADADNDILSSLQ